jgi:hypothetical protein
MRTKLKLGQMAELSGVEVPRFDGLVITWFSARVSFAGPAPATASLTFEDWNRIAQVLSRAYFPAIDTRQVSKLTDHARRKLAASSGTHSKISNRSRDFILGVAQAFAPLPNMSVSTADLSDVGAIHSDWLTVRSDIASVWTAVARFHDWLEQVGREGLSNGEDRRQAA